MTALEEACRALGAKIVPYRRIQNGRQVHAVRGGEKVLVNLYEGAKGSKIHIPPDQGPLGEALRARLAEAGAPASPWAAWIGADESGKGDFFGPLVVAAVRVTREQARGLARFGVRDSKEMGRAVIVEADEAIRKVCPSAVLSMGPEEYNAAYDGNLNRLLGRQHARVLAKLAADAPPAEAALVDRFGPERHILGPLKELGASKLALVMRERAESDPAVAAASVAARAEFVRGVEALEERFGLRLPLGAGPEVLAAGRAFVRKHGRDALRLAAKLHFRTAAQL